MSVVAVGLSVAMPSASSVRRRRRRRRRRAGRATHQPSPSSPSGSLSPCRRPLPSVASSSVTSSFAVVPLLCRQLVVTPSTDPGKSREAWESGTREASSAWNAWESQFLPYAANVVRVLTEYFKRAALPCLRIKVYSVMQVLLTSMGVGMALYLAEEVIRNAFADMNPYGNGNSLGSSNLDNSKVTGETTMGHVSRKRKHNSGAPKENIGADLGKESMNGKLTAPLSVRIAALGTLETLVTVAGSLRAECWRPEVDRLLITVAANACSVGWANERKGMLEWESSSTRADFQLAAWQALLASLLSHAYVRPPYLSQGLELFRRGKQEIGTKVAAFCTHAMLALEVFIHPWSLPLADFPVTKSSGFHEVPTHQPHGMFPGRKKSNLFPFSGDNDRAAVTGFGLIDDDLCNSWLDNGEETAVGVTNTDENMENDDVSGRAVDEPCSEGVPIVTPVDSHQTAEGSCNPKSAAHMNITYCDWDENVIKSRETGEPLAKDTINSSASGKEAPCQVIATSDISDDKEIMLGVSLDRAANKTDIHKDINAQDSLVSNKRDVMSYDSDSPSLDSLPDIVDANPDSD